MALVLGGVVVDLGQDDVVAEVQWAQGPSQAAVLAGVVVHLGQGDVVAGVQWAQVPSRVADLAGAFLDDVVGDAEEAHADDDPPLDPCQAVAYPAGGDVARCAPAFYMP